MDKVNKEKCQAWIDMFLAISRMTKNLSKSEVNYIKGNLSILYGEMLLKEE